MREIKFRAWDKINQQMVYNIQEMYDGYCDETDNGKYLYMSCFSCFLNDEQFAVMQYAGLKDKNGVEIYEGDVVKAQDPYPHIEKGHKYYICEVVFTEGATFMLKRQYNNYGKIKTEYFSMCIMEVEVIGNIYKNPELLKKEIK